MLTYNLGSQKSVHVVYCILSCSICSNAQIGYDYSLLGHTHKQFPLRTVWRHCELEKSSQYHRMRLTIFLLEGVTPRLGASLGLGVEKGGRKLWLSKFPPLWVFEVGCELSIFLYIRCTRMPRLKSLKWYWYDSWLTKQRELKADSWCHIIHFCKRTSH